MQRTQGVAHINGASLQYEIAGDGLPLVMVHGFTLDMHMWDDQFDVFAQHYRVLRYDVRGHGQSSVPASRYIHANDLSALLVHLDMPHASVIGHSMGGGIALDLACLHPDQVRALVLVNSIIGGYQEWTTLIDIDPGKRGLTQTKVDWLATPYLAPAMLNPLAAPTLQKIIDNYSGWHWLNQDPGDFPPPPAIDRLRDIHASALVIIGERDVPEIHRMADVLMNDLAHAQKVAIADVGHMASMEDPITFNRIALDFLKSLEAG